ncbi:hypothetical protein H4582DRAFT_1972589, partial [Lactarius indigo]
RRAVTPRTTVSTLNDDVLLNIFDWYRLLNTTDEDQGWNLERWWYKPIHVCQKWRHLILSSPTRLDLHLVCTYGIPVEEMLSHSPPLPIIIFYPEITAMENEFPMLERLALHSSTESRTGLVLPEKLRAPPLRHLTLSNIAFPIKSLLLKQAEGLITLRLWNLPASPEFHPAHMVAQLSGMSRLEILMIHFYAAIPNREVERRLWSAPTTQITLPSLKILAFRGGSAYLEGILTRLSAPLLAMLNVEFFNQLTFHLNHLQEFITFRSVEMHFDKDFVSMIVDPHLASGGTYPLLVQVKCKPLDWQTTCAVQICDALKDDPASWQDAIDHAQWHGLLEISLAGLVGDFFRSLKLDEGELPSELLPGLRELVPSGWGHTDDSFTSFISARQSAGRRIRLVRN